MPHKYNCFYLNSKQKFSDKVDKYTLGSKYSSFDTK